MKTERRRAQRLHPQNEIQLIFSCSRPMVGSVQDISSLGLSVAYEGSCQIDIGSEIVVNVVNGGNGTDVVGSLRCIPVYNIPTLAQGQSFRGKEVYLLGMAYGEMDPPHLAVLKRLLEKVV